MFHSCFVRFAPIPSRPVLLCLCACFAAACAGHAHADGGKANITVTSTASYPSGAVFNIHLNGEHIGGESVSITWRESRAEIAEIIANWINVLSDYTAAVNNDDPNRVDVSGGVLSIGMIVKEGCVGLDYHLDPPGYLGSLEMTAGVADGATCEGEQSVVHLSLNHELHRYALDPRMNTAELAELIVTDLLGRGYDAWFDPDQMRLLLAAMPNEDPIFDIGWHTSDRSLMQSNPTIVFECVDCYAEVSDFEVITGTHVAGDVESLRTSDDDHLIVGSGFGRTLLDLHKTEVHTIWNHNDGLMGRTMNIGVESSIEAAQGVATLALLNRDTGAFDHIARWTVLEHDSTMYIVEIPAADYVADDGEMVMSLTNTVAVPYLAYHFHSLTDALTVQIE